MSGLTVLFWLFFIPFHTPQSLLHIRICRSGGQEFHSDNPDNIPIMCGHEDTHITITPLHLWQMTLFQTTEKYNNEPHLQVQTIKNPNPKVCKTEELLKSTTQHGLRN